MDQAIKAETGDFLGAVGLGEEPMGFFFTDTEPKNGYVPKPGPLPSADSDAKGELDWELVYKNFSCVLGLIWLARKKKSCAYFEAQRYGCPGAAFYLGFIKPQSQTVLNLVTTGTPGEMPGELYMKTPEEMGRILDEMDVHPVPKKFCVFKPLSLFSENETPLLVCFFSRPEALCGLHQLAAFVTSDAEAVRSPWGAGCANIVTWPLTYLKNGENKAVLGTWDPSCRKFVKTDELSFTVPWKMYLDMLEQWRDSFLGTQEWQGVLKKVARSRRAWEE